MMNMIEILSIFSGAIVALMIAANAAVIFARLSHHDAFARMVQRKLSPAARFFRMGIGAGRF